MLSLLQRWFNKNSCDQIPRSRWIHVCPPRTFGERWQCRTGINPMVHRYLAPVECKNLNTTMLSEKSCLWLKSSNNMQHLTKTYSQTSEACQLNSPSMVNSPNPHRPPPFCISRDIRPTETMTRMGPKNMIKRGFCLGPSWPNQSPWLKTIDLGFDMVLQQKNNRLGSWLRIGEMYGNVNHSLHEIQGLTLTFATSHWSQRPRHVCLSRADEEAASFRSFRFFGTKPSKTS